MGQSAFVNLTYMLKFHLTDMVSYLALLDAKSLVFLCVTEQ